ncbi:uncharacterized protein LOC144735847 [Lampetra planeri]
MRDCSATPPALQTCSTPSVETLRATAMARDPGMEAGGTRNGETAPPKKTKPPILPKPPSPRRYGHPFGLTAGGLREGGSPPKDEAARASRQELCGGEAPLGAPKPGGTCRPVESAARRDACATQESADSSTKNDSGCPALVDGDSVSPAEHSQNQLSHITCSAIRSSKSESHSSEMQSRTSEIHSNDLKADTPESHSGEIHSSTSDIHSPDLRSCMPDIQFSGIQSIKPDIHSIKPEIQSSKPDIQSSKPDIQSSKPEIQPRVPPDQASSLPAGRKPPPPVAKKPTVSSLGLVSSSGVPPCSPSPSWPSSQALPLPVPEASPAERASGRSLAATADVRRSEPAGMALGVAGTPPPSPARPSTSAEFAASAGQSPGAACADVGRGAVEEEEREVVSVVPVDPVGGGGRGSDATDSALRRCCPGTEARTGDEERLSQLQVVAVTAEEAVGEASEDVFTDNDTEADERWDAAERSTGNTAAPTHNLSHTRTTEDLFAAIHRSKRIHLGRHNSDDTFLRHRSMSPPVRSPGTPSPGGVPGGARGPPARRAGRKQSTSSDDFKALLLRKGARSDVGTRMSAVEMLRSARSPGALAGAAVPDRPEDEAEFAEADAPARDKSRRFVSEGFSPRGGGGGFGGSPGTPPPRLGRSNTPPSAGSRRYNNRSRLHSTPMQAIREGEGEAGGDAVPS